jgi:D-alanine-D-alanine ligase
MNNNNNLLRLFRKKKLRIGVLLGGFSSEREISLRSGNAVANALISLGHPVKVIDVRSPSINPEILRDNIDFVFIALHGKFGEDGTLQGVLEKTGIPYAGSDAKASKNCFDKSLAKKIFQRYKISTAPYLKVQGSRCKVQGLDAFSYPVVVKPCNEGSSVGVSIANNDKELKIALKEASKYDSNILIEQYIKGREITVGILGNRVLPLIEIKPVKEFFTFKAKYQDKKTEYIVNPRLQEKVVKLIQKHALRAYRAAGCSGFARVDTIYSDKIGPVVLEINTIPGMTERSLLPKSARAVGIEFPQLCEKIIELSLKRYKTVPQMNAD